MFKIKKDKVLFLLTQDDSYWISDTQHSGWYTEEQFVISNDKTEVVFIEWLERLIGEGKISIADAIRAGIYYGK